MVMDGDETMILTPISVNHPATGQQRFRCYGCVCVCDVLWLWSGKLTLAQIITTSFFFSPINVPNSTNSCPVIW